jgi:hypothetical protein
MHGLQQRFVVTGLEFVDADQEAVGILLDAAGDLAGGKAVEGGLAYGAIAEVMVAGEG